MFETQMIGGAAGQSYLGMYGAQPASQGRRKRLDARQINNPFAPLYDLSQVYPSSVVASSRDLGWKNIRVLRLCHMSSELVIPPLENHCLILHLAPSLRVSARIDGRAFDRHLRPGEVTIIPAGAGAELRWTQTVSHNSLHIYLPPQFVGMVAASCELDHNRVELGPQFGVRDAQLRYIAMALLHELGEANIIGRLYAGSLAAVLAVHLVRRYSCLKDVQISKGGMAPHRLRRALEYMNERLEQEQKAAMSAVAAAAGMSYHHFCRAFKQSMGVSPNQYLVAQRVERAKRLLAETGLPIAQIAVRVGFASQSHFTTIFRRLAGTTPKIFRETL